MFCPRLCMCAACPWSAHRGRKITLDPLVLVTECWAARLMLWPELTFLQQHQGLLTLDYHFSSPQRFRFFVLGMELGCGACYIKPVLLSIPSSRVLLNSLIMLAGFSDTCLGFCFIKTKSHVAPAQYGRRQLRPSALTTLPLRHQGYRCEPPSLAKVYEIYIA